MESCGFIKTKKASHAAVKNEGLADHFFDHQGSVHCEFVPQG